MELVNKEKPENWEAVAGEMKRSISECRSAWLSVLAQQPAELPAKMGELREFKEESKAEGKKRSKLQSVLNMCS